MTPVKNKAWNLRGKERTPCTVVLRKKLSKYKNNSSSDLTKECYSPQIVFSYLSGTNLIYCSPYLIY